VYLWGEQSILNKSTAHRAEDGISSPQVWPGLFLKAIHVHHRLFQLSSIPASFIMLRDLHGSAPHRDHAAPSRALEELANELQACDGGRQAKRR
jgi:hypothetical protein